MRVHRMLALACAAAAVTACAREKQNAVPSVTVGTTHTLEDSGVLDEITKGFAAAHPDQTLKLVVAGSGEVIEMGRRGDVDALLTHAPDDENKFVADGYGVARQAVAHNDFLIAGPASDPATIASASSAADALTRIVEGKHDFVSRADDSGTHKKELSLWKAAHVKPDSAHYVAAGTGMADALRIADQKHAYILTDLATYLTLQHTLTLKDLYHGDPLMRNSYSVIVVTKARNRKGAEAFASWITGSEGQGVLGAYGREKFGRQLFIPDAARR